MIQTHTTETETFIEHGQVRARIPDKADSCVTVQVRPARQTDGYSEWVTVAETPNDDVILGVINGLVGDLDQLKKKLEAQLNE